MIKTIEDFKKDKKTLESDILRLIKEFEKKYNIYVNEIDNEFEIMELCDGSKDLQTTKIKVNINI